VSAGQENEDLAAKAADAVRRVIAEAEERAAEIVRDAEAKASSIQDQAEAEGSQIRERAERDARAQIEAAKRALDELGGTLAAAVSSALPKSESESPETEQEPAPEPEPTSEPEPPAAPEAPTSPPADAAPAGNGDDAAERLVAMKLAVEGKDREAIEAELAEKFGSADRSAMLDDVLSRATR
jgi:hypothetical protein